MPIIVDPSEGQTPPASVTTSPDGRLTCTVEANGRGVLLEYDGTDLGFERITDGGFESGTTNWQSYIWPGAATGSLSVTTTAPYEGAQSGRASWDTATTGGGFYQDLATPLQPGELLDVSFAARMDGTAESLNVALADDGGTWEFVVLNTTPAGEWHTHVVRRTVPDGKTLTQLYIYLEGIDTATMLDLDAVSAPTGDPTTVRFTRSDGEAVRSGDVALAPGGYAIAFDHEAPVGEAISYVATPDTSGSSSAGVMLGQPIDSIGLEGLWLKSIDNPDLSLIGEVVDWDDLQYTTRTASTSVLGKARPIVTVDAVSSPTSTTLLRTRGREAFKAMGALLGLPGYAVDPVPSVMLLDPNSLLMRPRSYAVVMSATPTQEGPVQLEQWVWSLEYQTVSRPDPTDAPLRIPGRSYASVAQIYTQYSDIPQSNASYVQLATG